MVEFYSISQVGQQDGESVVEMSRVESVRCNKCGVTYTDKESVEMVKKWIEEGYAPCPNISCPGEFELH